jgi:type II secretory pathway pseudopilin PulG
MLRHRRLLADQRGFTMVTVMMTMMVLGVFTVGAWSAATGDIPIARADQDRKVAYEAAQAGLQWYAYQLQANPNYWQQCGSVSGAPWVRNEWNGAGADPRTWRTLPTSKANFTLEVLDKVNPTTQAHTTCSTADPGGTALQDGTLRIRATGRSNGDYRSVVGTFRRKGFMDFIYFTQWETQDPAVSGATNCDKPRSTRGSGCVDIQFASADRINGPFHTNDESILTCDSPAFGRTGKSDNFEVAGAAPGYVKVCGTGVPTFNGPKVVPAGTLQMPDSNDKLKTYAGTSWTFTGQTCLTFKNNGTVDVQVNQSWAANSPGLITCSGPIVNRPLTGAGSPPNGVIFIENGAGCSGAYSKYQRYTNTAGCGDVAISGSYSQSVTIGARNDIIVTADLTHVTDAMMGLIAENFVRVYHPMMGTGNNCGNNIAGFAPVYQIDAAILALNHSFMVDNYHCGAALTDTPTDPAKAHHLNVNGAIAQYYRGTVATSGGSGVATGYIKNYNYDDRLKYRSPPNFLDPVQTSWQIIRQTEQQPATK